MNSSTGGDQRIEDDDELEEEEVDESTNPADSSNITEEFSRSNNLTPSIKANTNTTIPAVNDAKK